MCHESFQFTSLLFSNIATIRDTEINSPFPQLHLHGNHQKPHAMSFMSLHDSQSERNQMYLMYLNENIPLNVNSTNSFGNWQFRYSAGVTPRMKFIKEDLFNRTPLGDCF